MIRVRRIVDGSKGERCGIRPYGVWKGSRRNYVRTIWCHRHRTSYSLSILLLLFYFSIFTRCLSRMFTSQFGANSIPTTFYSHFNNQCIIIWVKTGNNKAIIYYIMHSCFFESNILHNT